MALEQNFQIWRGETLVVDCQVIDPAGTGINIAGFTIVWQLGTALTKSTTAGTIVLTAPATGWFRFTLSSTETLALSKAQSSYDHECKVRDLMAKVSAIFYGKVSIKGTIITVGI